MKSMTKILALLTTAVVLLCDTVVNAQISVAFSLALVGDGQLLPNERERENFDRVIDETIKKANEEAKESSDKGWPQLNVPDAAGAGGTSGWKEYVSDENGNVVEFDDVNDERRQLAAEKALPLLVATQGQRRLCDATCRVLCNTGAAGNSYCNCCSCCGSGRRRSLRALIESDEDLKDMAEYMKDEALALMEHWHHEMCTFGHEHGYELEVILVRDGGDGTEIKSNGEFKAEKKEKKDWRNLWKECKRRNKELGKGRNKGWKRDWKKVLQKKNEEKNQEQGVDEPREGSLEEEEKNDEDEQQEEQEVEDEEENEDEEESSSSEENPDPNEE